MENMKRISLVRGEPMGYPSESTLHELFVENAISYPDSIATVYEGRKTTMGELNEMSDALAGWLYHECGTRVGSIVGILMERCDEYVVAMLAALKTGAAFMPIEIVYPSDLIESVLEDSATPIILTKDKYLNKLPSHCCRCLVVDYNKTDWILAARAAPSLPTNRDLAHPDSMAYCVMSSGTTGKPKGICCPHRGMVHGIYHRLKNVPYGEEETEAIHVFFIWEVLRPLLGGVRGTPGLPVTAYLLQDNVPADPRKLIKILEEKVRTFYYSPLLPIPSAVQSLFASKQAITRILVTPSLLSTMLHRGGETNEEISNGLRYLRALVVMGEVLTTSLLVLCTNLLPGCKVINSLSISECHDITFVELYPNQSRPMEPGGLFANCGPPLNNVTIQVIKDDDFEGGDCAIEGSETVPIGDQGRILVGGPTLAIGYLNRPDTTRRRFVEVLLPGATQKERMYDTGDRGLIHPDGSIEVVGRIDYMVKIRGYSVVIPAVEAAISEHPDVSTTCVLVEGAEGTDKTLKAYIVPKVWEQVPTVKSLIAHLRERLPPYAFPKTFLLLDSLPVHPTGKTDRKALALDPDCGDVMKRGDSESSVSENRLQLSPTEKVIAEVWADVLDIPLSNLTHTSHFTEVGGHSLFLFEVLMGIKEKMTSLTLELDVQDLVHNMTIEALSKLIDSRLSFNGSAGDGDDTATGGSINLLEEVGTLDSSIFPAPTRNNGKPHLRYAECSIPPQRVFLTGATGFLGAHILSALLCSTHVAVHVLVRLPQEVAEGDKNLAARNRVISALRKMGLYEAADIVKDTDRCIVVCGDLSKPLLGLEHCNFKALAGELDAIVHCGAYVNVMLPYEALKAVNVLGTQEILRLAVTNGVHCTKVKPVHYISTFGVFQGSGGTCMEGDNAVDEWPYLEDGYCQSKWVAEQMCREALSRTVPLSIFRVGNMGPSSKTSKWSNKDDFMRLALLGCHKTGTLPIDAEWKFDMTPVDFAADSIAHIVAMCPNEAIGRVLHVTSPQEPLPISNLDMLKHEDGGGAAILLTPVSHDEWKHAVLKLAKLGRDDDITKLAMSIDTISGFFSQSRRFDCTQLLAALNGCNIKCPKINRSCFWRLFRVLIEE